MINDYQKITRKEYENLRNLAVLTVTNTLEYYNANDYSWISNEDINDIVSDGVIKALETFDVSKGCSLRTWTNLIVRQKTINFLHSSHETFGITYLTEDDDELEIPELANNVTAEDDVISWETSNRIDDILNTLKENDRAVFHNGPRRLHPCRDCRVSWDHNQKHLYHTLPDKTEDLEITCCINTQRPLRQNQE